jgi:hypothetical protein
MRLTEKQHGIEASSKPTPLEGERAQTELFRNLQANADGDNRNLFRGRSHDAGVGRQQKSPDFSGLFL